VSRNLDAGDLGRQQTQLLNHLLTFPSELLESREGCDLWSRMLKITESRRRGRRF